MLHLMPYCILYIQEGYIALCSLSSNKQWFESVWYMGIYNGYAPGYKIIINYAEKKGYYTC
jgi:hypothetical protein